MEKVRKLLIYSTAVVFSIWKPAELLYQKDDTMAEEK